MKPLAVRGVVPDNSEIMVRETTYRRGVPDDDDARARILSEALPLLSMTTSALREWEGQIRSDDDEVIARPAIADVLV